MAEENKPTQISLDILNGLERDDTSDGLRLGPPNAASTTSNNEGGNKEDVGKGTMKNDKFNHRPSTSPSNAEIAGKVDSNDTLEKGTLNDELSVGPHTPGSATFGQNARKRTTVYGDVIRKLSETGVELRGIEPVPEELRTDTQFNQIFTLWFTSLVSPVVALGGMLGPLVFGLSLRDTCLIILFILFLTGTPPAYIQTFSPRTGMRQMIQSRYSFGMYPNMVIVVLNLCTLTGILILGLIASGQTLAAVSGERITVAIGIAVTGVIAMIPPFFGFAFVHKWQRWAWIPAAIAMIIMVGCGASKLNTSGLTPLPPPVDPSAPPPPPDAPPSPEPEVNVGRRVMNFIALVAGFQLPYSSAVGDFGVYMPANAPKLRIFTYCLLGLCVPAVIFWCLGAAIGNAILYVPEFADAYTRDSVGGVLVAMLQPSGGFGKFVAVILALSIVSIIIPSYYSMSLNFQILMPPSLANSRRFRIPRPAFIIVVTGIGIGLAIKAAESFFNSMQTFLSITAYWSAAYTGIILTEWLHFRKGDPSLYDHGIWNSSRDLPTGLPALASLLISFGIVVPSMNSAWYVGPIAQKTGDLGFELAFVTSVLLYFPLRHLEIMMRGRL